MPGELPPNPSHPDSSLPPLVRKDGDREPPRDASVDPSPLPIVNGIPRGGNRGGNGETS